MVCEASLEGGDGACREVLRDLSQRAWGSPPRRLARVLLASAEGRPGGCRRPWVETPRTVVAAVAERLPEGYAEAFGRGRRGPCRRCPRGSLKWSSRVTTGSLRALATSTIGLPPGAFERPLLGTSGARLGARRGGRSERPSSQRLEVQETSCRGPLERRIGGLPAGPSWELGKSCFGHTRRGAEGRSATLCDSRLTHARRPDDRETSTRRRSGGVPDRESGPRSHDRASAGLGDWSREAETAAFEPEARLSQARFAASRSLPRGPLGARQTLRACSQRR